MTRRILFLGCGVATRLHSRILRSHPGVQLYFASRDSTRAEQCRRDFEGAGAFASYEGAVAHDVDVVVIATPPAMHLDHARLALDAGKHVVVEKPAFMHSTDADDIASMANARSLKVLVAENYAYKPITLRLCKLIADGALGDIRFVSINATKRQASHGWRADSALGGGNALFEGGIHWVSFVASLGLEIESVQGFPAGSDYSSLMVVRFSNGAVGTLAHSWELPALLGGLRASKIQGTRGAVTFESNGFALVVTGSRRSISLPAFGDPTGGRAMWRDFLSVLESGAEPRYTLQMARRDLRYVEEARSHHAVFRAHSGGHCQLDGEPGPSGRSAFVSR